MRCRVLQIRQGSAWFVHELDQVIIVSGLFFDYLTRLSSYDLSILRFKCLSPPNPPAHAGDSETPSPVDTRDSFSQRARA